MTLASPTPRSATSAPAERQDGPPIVLDLSRLLSRVLHAAPTGVDRVEMAFAQTLLRQVPQRLRFAATHPAGWHGALPHDATRRFLTSTAARWDQSGSSESGWSRWGHALGALAMLAPTPSPRVAGSRGIYLHLSSRGLERTGLLRAALARQNTRFVPFVHDLIPLTHPEFARPDGAALFRRKLATVTSLADGVLVNSHATAKALAPIIAQSGRRPPVHVVGLATSLRPSTPGAPPRIGRPYFVMLATIEPRKNHLLLLNIWRDLVVAIGADAAPRLVLVGRRGWENENILDMLERCPGLRGVVEELSSPPDKVLLPLLAGARALLMPSFVEGFGLPVVEALSLGAPVIASDLPALREAGGDVPDFLDPLDGPAWRKAILDYASPDSPRRRDQLQRMRRWRAPDWDEQIGGVLDFLAEIAR